MAEQVHSWLESPKNPQGHSCVAKLLPITKTAIRPRNPKYPKELVTLGDHIRSRRLDLGLEQQDVAKIIGVTTTSINNWELKRSTPEIRYY